MKGERGYVPKIDRVLDACRDFTERDFADLARAAADQAGLSIQEQIRLGRVLELATDAADLRRGVREHITSFAAVAPHATTPRSPARLDGGTSLTAAGALHGPIVLPPARSA